MIKKLLDLRFVIGLFFLLVGLLLVAYSLLDAAKEKDAESIDRWCGIVFGLFGVFMICLHLAAQRRDNKPLIYRNTKK